MPINRSRRSKHIRKRLSNMMIFLLFFIVFLIVFGGICLWAVIKINEERRTTGISSAVSSSSVLQFDESDAINLLFITKDGGQEQGFVVIRFDPAKERIRTLSIPRDTVMDYKTSEIRLSELVDQQGIPTAIESLKNLTGLQFDNYIETSYENVEKLIGHFESGVIMMLNEDVKYKDSSLDIDIPGGLRTLTASQAVDLLRYPQWHGGRKQRSDIQGQLLTALINQYTRTTRAAQADGDFSFLINHALKTDVRVSHYNSAKPGLAYLAERNKGSICAAVSLSGEYQGSGEAIRFYADDNIQKILKESF